MPHSNWVNSTRRSTLPRDWHRRRSFVRDRAQGKCEWPGFTPGRVERLPGEPCRLFGIDCDHIGDRDNHDVTNLQWLCHPHHDQKTIQDRRTRGQSDRRPPERHPGLRGK